MSAHNPIGSCCSKPRFNVVGGIDDRAWTNTLNNNSLVNGVRKVDRITAVVAVAGILAAAAVVFASTLLLAD